MYIIFTAFEYKKINKHFISYVILDFFSLAKHEYNI